jgi:hypothetical protein
MRTLFLSLLVLLLTVPAYALEGGTPPGVSGGTPPPVETGGTPPCSVKAPGILVCEGYADKPEAVLECKGYKDTVSKMSLDEVYVNGYRLIQIVDVKGKYVYYFQK